jgi:predicted dithiol-disulfide oxidoreductase (DUF899 family)
MSSTPLESAIELARQNGLRFPDESADYRHPRDALLAEEIELRRHIERVAAPRRALPPWQHLGLYSDLKGDFTRDYVSADDADVPGFNVFTRRDGSIRHFWSGEMGGSTADPGQDPRDAPDLMPLRTILDNRPKGRGTDWYPKPNYNQ